MRSFDERESERGVFFDPAHQSAGEPGRRLIGGATSSESAPWLLPRRQLEPELMDDPRIDAERHAAALRGLARINVVSRSAGILLRPIGRLAAQGRDRAGSGPLRVLDLATGGGDVPIRLCRLARRRGLALEIAGADVSARAVAHAAALAARANAAVQFFQLDARGGELPADYDVITSSLFLHHLADDEARALLRRMAAAARRLVLVSDLRRAGLGLAAAYIGTRTLTRSRIVHVDGPRSVRAAFSMGEVRELAGQAGLSGAHLSRHWPWRFLLEWRRPSA